MEGVDLIRVTVSPNGARGFMGDTRGRFDVPTAGQMEQQIHQHWAGQGRSISPWGKEALSVVEREQEGRRRLTTLYPRFVQQNIGCVCTYNIQDILHKS